MMGSKRHKNLLPVLTLALLPFLLGLTMSSGYIKDSNTEATEAAQLERDIDIIATLIYSEAWAGCSDRHKELVAAVVVNRVKSDKFPNTVEEVVTQPMQYHPDYADPESYYGKAARADNDIWVECREIARRAILGEVECPENVLFQAEFTQGTGIYEICWTSYSTTYFCYGWW